MLSRRRGWAESTLAVVFVALLGAASPRAALGLARDSDGDGMPNRWERDQGLNPHRANSGADPDHDRLINILEYSFEGDPLDRDTDGDGLRDGAEVTAWFSAVDVKDRAIGHVFAWGTCPTEDPPCPARSLFGIPVALEDAEGRDVALATTHTNGKFSLRAAPGTYRVHWKVPSYFQAPGPPRFITITRGQDRPARADFSPIATVGPGVLGQATQSPTCPVQRIGEECAAPLEGARIRIDNANGKTVASAVTGPDGFYSFSLEPGSYSLVAEPFEGNTFPYPPAPVEFTVGTEDSGPHWIASDYDTGIR